MFSNLNTMVFHRKFSTSISLNANISKGSPPFESFEKSLAILAYKIDNKFDTIEAEYWDILDENGGIELSEDNPNFEYIKNEFFGLIDSIGLELELANSLFENIKLTHPYFISNKLLEYNKIYKSILGYYPNPNNKQK